MTVQLSNEALRLCLSEQMRRHDITELERLTRRHQQLTRDLAETEKQLLEAYARVKPILQ